MTRDEQVLKDFTLPWADELLNWYDKYYPKTANGTIVMPNAKSCETYIHCTNPAPQIAGLQMVVAGVQPGARGRDLRAGDEGHVRQQLRGAAAVLQSLRLVDVFGRRRVRPLAPGDAAAVRALR